MEAEGQACSRMHKCTLVCAPCVCGYVDWGCLSVERIKGPLEVGVSRDGQRRPAWCLSLVVQGLLLSQEQTDPGAAVLLSPSAVRLSVLHP